MLFLESNNEKWANWEEINETWNYPSGSWWTQCPRVGLWLTLLFRCNLALGWVTNRVTVSYRSGGRRWRAYANNNIGMDGWLLFIFTPVVLGALMFDSAFRCNVWLCFWFFWFLALLILYSGIYHSVFVVIYYLYIVHPSRSLQHDLSGHRHYSILELIGAVRSRN